MTTPQTIDFLRTAIRIHPTRTGDKHPPTRSSKRTPTAAPGAPRRALIFDCETTSDTTQQLNFGVWRYYIDDRDTEPGTACVEEGIFFDDDLPDRDPDGYTLLCDYVRKTTADVTPGFSTTLRLMTRKRFVEDVLWRRGYEQQADIVGFNLPFDLSRLAVHAAPARGKFRGGVSLRLWSHNGAEHPFRPRIVIRPIGGRRALIEFTRVKDGSQRFRGKFVDLATLAFAHSDRKLSLERACDYFGAPYTKRDVVHGTITSEYVAYCREDVTATADLYRALMVEHHRHPIDLEAHRTMSPASIGKAYWKAMGITPFNQRSTPIDPTVAGYGMAAFYGGRAECRIRATDTPVVYVDFKSMYITCNALMQTWPLITSQHIATRTVTKQVRKLVADPNLRDRCFDPKLWPQLTTLVEIEPNGAILPVRAQYTPRGSWGIGVNPLHTDGTRWYALADVLAAVLLGGPTPTIKRALRLTPTGGFLDDLQPVSLRGDVALDPITDDFYTTVVEQRHRIRNDPDRPPLERERLEKFIKVLANATGYGILAQYDRKELTRPIELTAHTDHTNFTVETESPEDPGPYNNPPLAACATAAARLMLALLEHEVTRHDGNYVFCDTDSMAIVATPNGDTINCAGQTLRALDWATVQGIVDTFESLNPYDPNVVGGSILEMEKENFDPDTGEQRELRCYSLSAKRYQLTTAAGEYAKDPSEHGLGHLINPRDDGGEWFTDAWNHIRNPDFEPDWLDLPALSRVTVTSPHTLHWFKHVNRGRNYGDWIKPANFLLLGHPDPLGTLDAKPITAFTTHPSRWEQWEWIDRDTGQPCTVHVKPSDGNERPGTRILTYRDVLARYRHHPEAKSHAPDHTTCRGSTTGLLHRRPIHAIAPVTYIGKEAHRLEERTLGITDTDDCHEYTPVTEQTWRELVVTVLARISTSDIVAATGVHKRTVQRARNGTCLPRTQDRDTLYRYAVAYARDATHASRADDDECILYRYVTTRPDT